jgi:Pyrimidine dimer DNA glycosylase
MPLQPTIGGTLGGRTKRAGCRMRLWSLHPKYLDACGLVALWREGLLAQAVLRGRTAGYRHHPQLQRFRAQPSPLGSIADYLRGVNAEAVRRGYRFAGQKISSARGAGKIVVTLGQAEHEWRHLMSKLANRDPELHERLGHVECPETHPLFRVAPGCTEPWERNTTAPNNRSDKRLTTTGS